jgi:hypothetical protein
VGMTENDLRRFIKMNPDANWEYDHTWVWSFLNAKIMFLNCEKLY